MVTTVTPKDDPAIRLTAGWATIILAILSGIIVFYVQNAQLLTKVNMLSKEVFRIERHLNMIPEPAIDRDLP